MLDIPTLEFEENTVFSFCIRVYLECQRGGVGMWAVNEHKQ